MLKSVATRRIPDSGIAHYLNEKKQLAEWLGLSVKFLRRRRDLRLPPQYARLGNRVRYPLESVEAFEAAVLAPVKAFAAPLFANQDIATFRCDHRSAASTRKKAMIYMKCTKDQVASCTQRGRSSANQRIIANHFSWAARP